jgi:hypothetical protein
MKLPNHIIDNVERRWAAKLQQEVDIWREGKHLRHPVRSRVTQSKEHIGLDQLRRNRVQHPA